MVTPGQIYYYLAAYLSYFPLLVCGTDAKTNRDCKPVCSNRSVEKAYQQLYCKNVSMVYFMKDWSKELPIPFRLAARKLYLLQRRICFVLFR